DPLIRFGVSDGLPPQRLLKESIALRDVLIRYTLPHLELVWDDLSSRITGLQTLEHLSSYMHSLEVDTGHSPRYCIAPEILVVFGHVCLTVQQVLDGLAEFLNKSHRQRFSLDLHHCFLKLL
ncbi:hypothetical protein B0H17DRAFT_871527, partial [Mycena rosella]